jgi:sigma-B regulation protein RsbU (phosphoserine phosphatase)
MARSRRRRPFVAPVPDRQSGLRHVLLRTLPGRLIVVGLIARVLIIVAGAIAPLPAFFNVVDTIAGLAIAIGAVYFVVRLFAAARRRLLWRVRRKLILSYIFVGFIPVLLIAAFFLLGGYLLFYNFSTYLVQNRFAALADQARFIAQSAALEIQRGGGRDAKGILERRQTNTAAQFPGVSLALVPVGRECSGARQASASQAAETPNVRLAAVEPALVTAGPWAHTDPPRTIPSWIDCAGFAGVVPYFHDAAGPEDHVHLLVRGVAFPDSSRPGYAIVADFLIDDAAMAQLRRDTGVTVQRITGITDNNVRPLYGRASDSRAAGADALSRQPSLVDYRDWATGKSGTLMVYTRLNVGELYDRISSASGGAGRTFGQGLLLALGVIGILFLIIEFLALVAGLALAKSITGSVHELFIGTGRVRQGDFTHKIAVKADDQLGELASSFNSMTASIEDLLREAAEKKRLEEELRIAHEIQMSLLPQGALKMPGVSLTALCVPAREVGGDYYDFITLDDHRLGVLIADVSGKGTSAALYMAELKGLVLSLSRIHRSPRELLINANRIIAEHLDARSFITMTYAVIDLRSRVMTYARAGHTPLIYLPGGGPGRRRVQILAPDGLVLGLKLDKGEMFERLLEEETIPVHPGDLYLFFTDGITEAMNEMDDCFGEQRLGQLVEDHADLPSSELRERVLREIESFVGRAPQHDDMTMILLKIDSAETAEDAETAELAVGRERGVI